MFCAPKALDTRSSVKSKLFKEKARQYLEVFRHFQNPILTLLMRLGWIRMAHCSFRIRKAGLEYTMLGRPRRGDLWLLREVLVEETYRSLLKYLPAHPLRVVDVGSHIGAFTIWLHRHHAIQEAFCFEPEGDSFALCEFNIRQNGCRNVRLRNEALGASTRETEIWMDAVTHARSTLHKRSSSTEQHARVHVVGFCEWLEQVGGDFDVLKMDCEGSEWEILEAAPEGFARFSVVVAEVHAHPDGSRPKEDFAAILRQHGFTQVNQEGLYIGRREADVLPQSAVHRAMQ